MTSVFNGVRTTIKFMKIYPIECTKSRQTLALLQESVELEVVEYLKICLQLSLSELIGFLGISP